MKLQDVHNIITSEKGLLITKSRFSLCVWYVEDETQRDNKNRLI